MGVSKYQKKQLANAAFYTMNQSRNDTLMLVLVLTPTASYIPHKPDQHRNC